jgi:hypothetical protein
LLALLGGSLLCFIGRGYVDVNGMNVVSLLGIERNHCQIAIDIASLDFGRLSYSGGTWLHSINSLAGDLYTRVRLDQIALFDAFFSFFCAIGTGPLYHRDSLVQPQVAFRR